MERCSPPPEPWRATLDVTPEIPLTAPVPGPVGAPVAAPHYRTTQVDGVDLFYREAGSEDAPVVVLPHGFPTSSHMFRHVLPALADRYHVIAPDYPGFGLSAMRRPGGMRCAHC